MIPMHVSMCKNLDREDPRPQGEKGGLLMGTIMKELRTSRLRQKVERQIYD
jgi:hypothetical protein